MIIELGRLVGRYIEIPVSNFKDFVSTIVAYNSDDRKTLITCVYLELCLSSLCLVEYNNVDA